MAVLSEFDVVPSLGVERFEVGSCHARGYVEIVTLYECADMTVSDASSQALSMRNPPERLIERFCKLPSSGGTVERPIYVLEANSIVTRTRIGQSVRNGICGVA